MLYKWYYKTDKTPSPKSNKRVFWNYVDAAKLQIINRVYTRLSLEEVKLL